MSQPRRVMPGTTYLLSRRTSRRLFVFRPDADGTMQNIFWYCLAVTANEHGVLVHAATLMSSHPHLVITDVRGVLPDFLREFHRLLANTTKRHRDWPEEVFNASETSSVQLPSAPVVVDKVAYTIANPVEAFAVRYARDWPGATVAPEDIGRRIVRAHRPLNYFRADNPRWPAEVTLRISMPDALVAELGSDEAARHAIAESVREHEHRAWREAECLGRGFCGARRSMNAPLTACASSREESGSRNPTFAAGRDSALARELVGAVRAFRAAYRTALERWRAGARDVLFPSGTWLMRVVYGAQCEAKPA